MEVIKRWHKVLREGECPLSPGSFCSGPGFFFGRRALPQHQGFAFLQGKALSYGEGWVSTRQCDLLAGNCCGKLPSHLDGPRVKGPLLMRGINIWCSGPQGLRRWLKSCQPSVSVGVMQLGIWGRSFSVNALPCCWYLVLFLLQLRPSLCTDRWCCQGLWRCSSSSTQKCLAVLWSSISPWMLQEDEHGTSQGQAPGM